MSARTIHARALRFVFADKDVANFVCNPSVRGGGGHSILVIAWHLLSGGVDYCELGGDWFTRGTDPERRKTRLVKQLQELGYAVSLRAAA